MGYPRLDMNKQVELLPSILNCLEGRPTQHQDRCDFFLLLENLSYNTY